MKTLIFATLFISLIAAAPHRSTPFSGPPIAHPIDSQTSTHKSGGDDYIVIFNDGDVQPHIADVLTALDLSTDHQDVRKLYNSTNLRGFSASMKSHCIDILNARDDIAVVEKAQTITTYVTARSDSPWGLQRISSTASPSGSPDQLTFTYSFDNAGLGAGADIYIVDTGTNTAHVAFEGRAKSVFRYPGTDDTDGDGHGTHTAGTAAAAVFGVASSANILAVKVLDENGSGQTPDVVDGLDFIIDNHNKRKSEPGFVGSVINMSWGMPGNSSAILNMVQKASAAGIHMVAASGNQGISSCSQTPSNIGGTQGPVISVGSVGFGSDISSFSNTGTCTDVYAAGESIISTWTGGDNVINILDGTSMACPHVAGLVAYLMVEKPELASDVKAMKSFIASSALQHAIAGNAEQGDPMLLANNGITGADVSGLMGVVKTKRGLDIRIDRPSMHKRALNLSGINSAVTEVVDWFRGRKMLRMRMVSERPALRF